VRSAPLRVALAAVLALVFAQPARALEPGALYAISGTPGANAFLPGLSNLASLENGQLTTSFVSSANNRRVSDSGRYVAFVSFADALSNADDDRFANVYVQDRDTGAVELASLPAAGGSGAGASIHPALSGNGRRVAFASTAQLVPQDTDTDSDVYLRDLDTGATILVSRRSDTGAQGAGVNGDPDISHDGTVVAFSSTVMATFDATDTDTSGDVYKVDLALSSPSPVLVSRATGAGDDANAEARGPAVSGDGSAVAFETLATNLAGAVDVDAEMDVYLRDGLVTTLVSRATGAGAKGNDGSHDPAISDDGNYVAFMSYSNNLDALDGNSLPGIYLRSIGTGTTVLVSRQTNADGGANASSYSVSPTVSIAAGPALRVAFLSQADNLDPAASDDRSRAWVRNVTTGVTSLASRHDGAAGAPATIIGAPSIATAGTAVAFTSWLEPALSSEDDDSFGAVYLRDGDTTAWRSRPATGPWQRGAQSASLSDEPGRRVSADGRYVVFAARSNAYLPAGESSTGNLIVRRDVRTGETLLVSRATGSGGAIADDASSPVISADGSRVAFLTGTPLEPGAPDGVVQVYVRDVDSATTMLASRLGAAAGDDRADYPSLSGDGRRVAFESRATNLGVPGGDAHVYVHDLGSGDTQLASRAGGAGGAPADQGASTPALDGDGSRVAFSTYAKNLDPADTDTNASIYVRDLSSLETTLVSRAPGGAPNDDFADAPVLSADGQRVAFLSRAANLDPADADANRTDVFVHELATGATALGSAPGNGSFSVDDYDLSADGSTLAWTTPESLLPEDADAEQDAYVRELGGGATSLAGRKATGEPLDGGVSTPALSADGGCLAFTIVGTGEYADGPIVSPNLPGSAPSPDFRQVVMRALKPTCAPLPPAPPGPAVTPDTTAPRISNASMSNRRFRRTRAPTALVAARRGTRFRFTLSETATVTIALQRRLPGRLVRGKCRKPAPRLRTRKRCTRFVTRGTLTRAGLPAGANRVRFSGRVGRRALPLGPYRAVLRAVDAAGNRSAATRLRFRIVRR
jgi:Tol biopolymer transport system component